MLFEAEVLLIVFLILLDHAEDMSVFHALGKDCDFFGRMVALGLSELAEKSVDGGDETAGELGMEIEVRAVDVVL
jgi:hypothetical protein